MRVSTRIASDTVKLPPFSAVVSSEFRDFRYSRDPLRHRNVANDL
jgi:hypothetical protein